MSDWFNDHNDFDAHTEVHNDTDNHNEPYGSEGVAQQEQDTISGSTEDTAITDVNTDLKAKETSKVFSWKDMADFSNFRTTYDQMSEKQLAFLHSMLKNTRTTDSALVVAKKLFEDGVDENSQWALDIVNTLLKNIEENNGQPSMSTIINFSTTMEQVSTDVRFSVVKMTNVILPGEEIRWRKNAASSDLATKILEKAVSTDAEVDHHLIQFTDDLLKMWPGNRSK